MKFVGFSRLSRVWSAFMVLGMLALVSLPAIDAVAQSTSADIRGRVVSEGGNAVSGATVQILHLPSGTVSEAETGETGGFFRSGLRVGGPYQITVQAEGYEGEQEGDIFLEPGSQDPLVFTLSETGRDLDRLQVVGTAISEATALNNGVGSTFSARDIQNQPSADRDVISTLARDPLVQSEEVGIMSVAGTNPRFNAFAIDGSLQQDDFGLSDGTYATTRSPINLDAVESATLVASDYSVTSSGFTGGLVNVVTKSGTNEFDGSLYYAYQDDSMIGEDFDGGTFDPGDFEEEEYGFTLGGPIVKDKLFFFVSYDEYENASPVDFTNSDQFNGVDPGFFEVARQAIQDTYGFDPGGRPQVVNVPEISERTLAKVDWNITSTQRLSLTYQKSEENDTSVGADEFESAWYDIPLSIEAYTAELFSDWTYNFSTNLRVNYTEKVRGQNCRAGTQFGQISLDFFDLDSVAGSPLEGLLTEDGNSFIAGCDNFRHANAFDDERLQVFASGEYFMGDHLITFGTEYQQYDLFNAFIPFSNGDFQFSSYDDLVNGTADVFYSNVSSNDAQQGAAQWGYDHWAFFVQDTWSVTPDFELSYGVRYERFDQSDAPQFSQAVFDEYGVDTSNNIDGNDLIMPRIGFFWRPWDRASISGGFGLYAGGDPKVWTSNAFQNPTFGAFAGGVQGVDFTQVPQQLIDQVAQGTAMPIDYIDEDFDTPSDWKGSVRFEQAFDFQIGGLDLGDNYRFTAQYLYTEARDGFIWKNLAHENDAALPLGTAPDGRPIYADLEDLGIPNLTQLTNSSGANSSVISVGLAKYFDSGVNFNFSYAYQDTEIVSEGTSSRGISNWRSIFAADRNNPDPRTSPFQVEHSFKLNLGYERAFFGSYATRVDLFGRVFKGDVFSTSFDVSDDNALFGRAGLGEDPFDNSPLYIPDLNGDPRVVYGSGFNFDEFAQYVRDNNISTGEIHDPYSSVSNDWNNIWDLRFQQEIPSIPGLDRFVGDNRFKVVLDIENFLNLINDDWGRYTNGPFFGQAPVVAADLVSAADVAANGIDGADALTGDQPRQVCQSAGDCVYRYNDFDGDPTAFTDRERSVYEIRLTLRYDF
ncbi:TonB-dependent receptor [Wenzhouxiangella sp. EGI_FJ10305]|uniref:TonB-dependent receptor n=1 Tax=Wenzhouxiangella sp. EGI_FJ10305 TaxID=3243768 RepID=UPI0035DF347B